MKNSVLMNPNVHKMHSTIISFLNDIIDFDLPPQLECLHQDWSVLSAEHVEIASKDFKHSIWPKIRQSLKPDVEIEWGLKDKNIASELTNLFDKSKSLSIDEISAYTKFVPLQCDNTNDFIYTKLNHGFWDALFAGYTFGKSNWFDRPFIQELGKRGVYNRLASPYIELLKPYARINEFECLCFKNLKVGVGFSGGETWHDDLLKHHKNMSGIDREKIIGRYSAMKFFFDQIDSAKNVTVYDGAFPKCSILEETLSDFLNHFLSATDELVFVTPEHLDGIKLRAASNIPQRQIFISRRLINDSWLVTLTGVCPSIFNSLANGKNVMVISQASSVSFLIGLFLKNLKDKLALPGKLYFFDLGQALDVVETTSYGNWKKKALAENVLRDDIISPFVISN